MLLFLMSLFLRFFITQNDSCFTFNLTAYELQPPREIEHLRAQAGRSMSSAATRRG